MSSGVLFDLDGTLVDSNYLHVVAWSDAFRARGYSVPMCDILPLIGQGSDLLVQTVIGHEDEAVVTAHADFYGPRLYDVRAFEGAGDLLRRCQSKHLVAVLATSAGNHEVSILREAIDADDALASIATDDDADASKPAPDIVAAALDAAGLTAESALFVGDSVWDVKAAAAAGVSCVCVLTGGIPEHLLREAGAVAVYPSVGALLAEFDDSPLGELAAQADH
jgi:phosphoglycolate phosphatase-like HAD superfamily hydrolase